MFSLRVLYIIHDPRELRAQLSVMLCDENSTGIFNGTLCMSNRIFPEYYCIHCIIFLGTRAEASHRSHHLLTILSFCPLLTSRERRLMQSFFAELLNSCWRQHGEFAQRCERGQSAGLTSILNCYRAHLNGFCGALFAH